jgi:hypothetical protein
MEKRQMRADRTLELAVAAALVDLSLIALLKWAWGKMKEILSLKESPCMHDAVLKSEA